VPVCWESYDFITTKEFIEDEKVAGFIDVLKSKEFKDALEKLGGYEISGIGEVECI
jgi:putative molybdopterin biosynthesis protein